MNWPCPDRRRGFAAFFGPKPSLPTQKKTSPSCRIVAFAETDDQSARISCFPNNLNNNASPARTNASLSELETLQSRKPARTNACPVEPFFSCQHLKTLS